MEALENSGSELQNGRPCSRRGPRSPRWEKQRKSRSRSPPFRLVEAGVSGQNEEAHSAGSSSSPADGRAVAPGREPAPGRGGRDGGTFLRRELEKALSRLWGTQEGFSAGSKRGASVDLDRLREDDATPWVSGATLGSFPGRQGGSFPHRDAAAFARDFGAAYYSQCSNGAGASSSMLMEERGSGFGRSRSVEERSPADTRHPTRRIGPAPVHRRPGEDAMERRPWELSPEEFLRLWRRDRASATSTGGSSGRGRRQKLVTASSPGSLRITASFEN